MTEQDRPRFIVICGPELCEIEYHSQMVGLATDALRDAIVSRNVAVVVFPEKTMGAEAVRQLTTKTTEVAHTAIFVTRYEHCVSQLANLVVDEKIPHADVEFWLLRKDEHGEHQLTKHRIAGQFVGNDWPLGILW